MPEATQDIHDSLDASVAALVGGPAAAPAPAAVPAIAPPASTEIDFDSLAADAVANLISDSAKSQPPLEGAVANLVADAPPPAPDLAEAVSKLIEEAPAPAAESPPQPVPDRIETLDAQIANLADDLIAGEFADEQSVLQGELGRPPAAAEPVAPPELAPPPPTAAAPAEPAPELSPPEPKAAAPAPAKVPSPAPQAPAAAPATARPDRLAAPRKAAGVAAKIAARQGVQAAAGLGPIGIGLLAILSKPLRKMPKARQDLIGWIALITLFNALCLWGYILFFRSAHPPAGAQATVAKAGAGHEASAGHETKSDAGHGKAPDKKTEKAPPAKKTPAKKEAKGKTPPAKSGGH